LNEEITKHLICCAAYGSIVVTQHELLALPLLLTTLPLVASMLDMLIVTSTPDRQVRQSNIITVPILSAVTAHV
jgi:hypothetical protein